MQTIRAEVLALMGEEKALYDRLLRNAVLLFERGVEDGEGETGDVYVDGASNILAKPDFSDVERLRELFRTFEAKSRLVKILNECIAREPVFGDVHVVIGREHTAPSLPLVRAHHRAVPPGRGLRRGHRRRGRPDAPRVRAHDGGGQLHRAARRARAARGGALLTTGRGPARFVEGFKEG